MPVIPATMLPQPPGGSARYARAEMPGVRFQARASAGTAALSAAASALPDLAGKVAGLWFQANLKAKEAKAAMDLDEIRVRAEAAHRDGMRELAQDPDGYETFGDRSQKAFLALRQDCRELLDGLPPEHRRRAELYLTGQAARWRDDTSRLQYQARITALDARAKGSIEGQLDAADWDGARATAQSALDSQVWSRARYDAAMADIGHREAFAAKLAEVKARPADFTGLADAGEDGKWTMEASGLTAQDRERQAAHARALCGENAREMRERYMAAMDAGEPFDTAEFSRAADGGRITRDQADSLLRVARGREAKAAHDAFELSLADGSLATPEKVDEAEKAVRADASLPDAEKAWRLDRLARERLRLEAGAERAQAKGERTKAREEREADRARQDFYLERKMRAEFPGLFGDAAPVTQREVGEWLKQGKITRGQAYDLLHTALAVQTRREEAARRLADSRAKVAATVAIEDMEVPDDPAERKALFDEADEQLFERFYAADPETYLRLSRRLEEALSPDPRGWRANPGLKGGWDAYLDEQREKDFFSVRTTRTVETDLLVSGVHERVRTGRDASRAPESFRKWQALMYDWLARNPKATEADLRKYGDALRLEIQRTEAGARLDDLFAAAAQDLRENDISRKARGREKE